MQEIWKPIPEYETLYEVSTLGRVKSLQRKVPNRTNLVPERVMKLRTLPNGYVKVSLQNQNEKIFTVHRLVALTFLENPENKKCVDHIDCDRTNNSASNLRWATYSENNLRPFREGDRSPYFGRNKNLIKNNNHE